MADGALSVAGSTFRLDGRPLRLMGGALHYARIPRPYWRDRQSKLIDLGCNTVESYGFWNAHEPYPSRFEFSGMLDVVGFVELAGSMGLSVIYRPRTVLPSRAGSRPRGIGMTLSICSPVLLPRYPTEN